MKVRSSFLLFCRSSIGVLEKKEVEDTLSSGWLTMGPKVLEFEKKFAEYIGVKYAVAVNSCTAALHLAVLAHGIGKGDEVIVPSQTFVSTVNVLLFAGAKPVFGDIEKSSYNLDPLDIEKKITKKTKAIVVVHYGGLSANLKKIQSIARKHKLVIIEDAAHAVGTKYNGKYIGSHGNTTCFSFYATKNLTTGEGGMLTTDNPKIAEYVQKSRMHGISKDAWKRYSKEGSWKYDVEFPGFKYNMTDIQASLGLHQLKRLPGFLKRRRQIAALFDKGFKGSQELEVIQVPKETEHSYHLYPILLQSYDRDIFIEEMKKMNIGVSVHFIPVHQFSYYKKNYPVKKNDMLVTNDVFNRIVSLPIYPDMTDADVRYVTEAVLTILRK